MFSKRTRRGRQKWGSPERVGLASGLRLGSYYALFFAAVAVILFSLIYRGVSRTIQERELEIVRNRAREYRAWFLNGDTDMLAARMDEQSLESGEVMFVRVTGPELRFVNFLTAGGGAIPPEDEVLELDARIEGFGIELGGEPWTIASLRLGRSGLILQAAKSSRAAHDTLAKLRGQFFLTLLPSLIAAVLGGTVLTFRAMAPIRQLIATMRGILQGGDLERRAEPRRGRNELNALVDLFNRLLARNKALIDSMRHSLDSVAHDLRTPLSRINITAERALEEGDNPKILREALADCVEESAHLNRLLTALMEVTEAESGAMRLEFERLSLPDLVESVVELYEFVAEDKGVTVKTILPVEQFVQGDRTRLSQALANLLDNAIKYSPRGGDVEIEMSAGSERIVLAVRNEGLISERDLPYIWDRLYRAEPSRTTRGMGLGLSFVKAIVEAHQGTASVTNTKGVVEFRIELPATTDAGDRGSD